MMSEVSLHFAVVEERAESLARQAESETASGNPRGR
jgi:hypothetical protein